MIPDRVPTFWLDRSRAVFSATILRSAGGPEATIATLPTLEEELPLIEDPHPSRSPTCDLRRRPGITARPGWSKSGVLRSPNQFGFPYESLRLKTGCAKPFVAAR